MPIGDNSHHTIAIDLLLGPVGRSPFGTALVVPSVPVGGTARGGLAGGGQGEGFRTRWPRHPGAGPGGHGLLPGVGVDGRPSNEARALDVDASLDFLDLAWREVFVVAPAGARSLARDKAPTGGEETATDLFLEK